jgi:hypothetical protein
VVLIIGVGVLLALLMVLLRRVSGLRYWTVAIGLMALAIGALQWIFEWQKAANIFLVAFPISVAFVCGNPGIMRSRPWLVMLVVPIAFIGSFFAGLVVGANLDFLTP